MAYALTVSPFTVSLPCQFTAYRFFPFGDAHTWAGFGVSATRPSEASAPVAGLNFQA